MRITISPARNVAYIRFADAPAAGLETVAVSEDVFIDRTPDGRVYGIELLNAAEQLLAGSLEVENEESGESALVRLPFPYAA